MFTNSLDDFFHYLLIERGLSENTLTSYKRDLKHYTDYISKTVQRSDWNEVTRNDIVHFLHKVKDSGKSAATISRYISSIRAFHQFLFREQLVTSDASLHLEIPKKERKLPDVLSVNDVEKLLSIKGDSALAVRNTAMLELLYATGLRVSELIT